MPAGPPPGTGAYNFLTTYVLTQEEPREYYQSEDDQVLDEYLHANPGSINYFQLYDMLTTDWAYGADVINLVPIVDKAGKARKPSSFSFDDGEYTLMRDIYLGVNMDPSSLERTLPFLEFGLSSKGSQALKDSGFWPINDWEKVIMHTRLNTDHGYTAEDIREHCGPNGGSLATAGSTAITPVSDLWAGVYLVECDAKITTEGGGTSSGAARLCADTEVGSPVDIANMSRDWKDSETAERSDEFVHDCIIGDERRSSFAVDVAVDGLAVLVPLNGAGHSCISILGGLTKDQLRWIFSSYSEVELIKSGWDPASLKSNDGNPSTHKYNELDVRCDNTEIQLVGSPESSGTGASFEDYVLTDKKNGEMIRPVDYLTGDPFDNIIDVLKHKESIGKISFHYYYQKQDVFYAVPLLNDNGSFVAPTLETVGDGSFPVVRRLTMNLLNRQESLKNTVPLLDFGFNHPELLYASGYVPLPEEQVEIMLDRLYSAPYAEDATNFNEKDAFVDIVGMSSILGVTAGLLLLTCLGVYVCLRMCSRHSKKGV